MPEAAGAVAAAAVADRLMAKERRQLAIILVYPQFFWPSQFPLAILKDQIGSKMTQLL